MNSSNNQNNSNSRLHLGLYGLSKNCSQVQGYDIVERDSSISVLQKAYLSGISVVDTSPFYGNGNADELILELTKANFNFLINTKVGRSSNPSSFQADFNSLANEIISVHNIHQENLNCIYLHSPPTEFIEEEKNFEDFSASCKDICGDAISVGISLANPSHLEFINKYKNNIYVQFNFSWFDLRAFPYLSTSKRRGHILTGRSLFASGLLDLLASSKKSSYVDKFSSHDIRSDWNIDRLFNNCMEDCERIRKLTELIKPNNIPLLAFSLLSVVDCLDNVVIGPLNSAELHSSIKYFNMNYDNRLVERLRSYLPS